MGAIQYSLTYLFRNKFKSLLIVSSLTIIFLMNLIGECLYTAAQKGESDAFYYNEEAFSISNIKMNEKEHEQLCSIAHVTGVDCRKWWDISSDQLQVVRTHTGADVRESESQKLNTHVLLMANMDVSQDTWFRREKSVELVEGNYPTFENDGILLEKHMAEQSDLNIGDHIQIKLLENNKNIDLQVCGIYSVNSDFKLKPEEGFQYSSLNDIFGASPYNRVYANYKTILEQLNEETNRADTWRVYVDQFENTSTVAAQVRDILGEEAEIYDNASDYLQSTTAAVVVVKNFALLILRYVLLVGIIILLIIMTYFGESYSRECGIMIALGYSKARVGIRYLCVGIANVMTAIILSGFLYCAVGNFITTAVENTANDRTKSQVFTYYEVEGIDEDFQAEISITDVLESGTALKIVGFDILGWGVCTLIPFGCVINTKPRKLLK